MHAEVNLNQSPDTFVIETDEVFLSGQLDVLGSRSRA